MTLNKPEAERLQKMLARLGLGSRREIENWITSGRISINGQCAKLGDKASLHDKIALDGELIRFTATSPTPQVLMYYKREGEICSKQDPRHENSVFKHIPKAPEGRWVMVGRLDINSSGLLLFTNDGELANRLMHPKFEIEREYAVRVLGELTPAIRQNLLRGVMLEDGKARFLAITDAGGQGANKWYHVTLKEGRNREVRRLFESQELQVSRLLRVRYGPVKLPETLRQGMNRLLSKGEVAALLNAVGHDKIAPTQQEKKEQHESRSLPKHPRRHRPAR